jgi:hypothetical protein
LNVAFARGVVKRQDQPELNFPLSINYIVVLAVAVPSKSVSSLPSHTLPL